MLECDVLLNTLLDVLFIHGCTKWMMQFADNALCHRCDS